MRVRGLKHAVVITRKANTVSHPVRVRGLKPINWEEFTSLCSKSHPMRVRGLKHVGF